MPPLSLDQIAAADARRFTNSAGFQVFLPVGKPGGASFRGSLSRHFDQLATANSGTSVYNTFIHGAIVEGVKAGDRFRGPDGRVWEVNSVDSGGGTMALSVSLDKS